MKNKINNHSNHKSIITIIITNPIKNQHSIDFKIKIQVQKNLNMNFDDITSRQSVNTLNTLNTLNTQNSQKDSKDIKSKINQFRDK